MSLINDALRRASRTHRRRSDRPREPSASSRPAQAPVAKSKRPAALGIAIPTVGLVVLVFGVWAIWEWRQMSQRFENFSDRDHPIVLPARKPEPAQVSTRPVLVPPTDSPATVVSSGLAVPVLPTARTEPRFPELKLQGVFFSRQNPSVLINGKNRSLGDTIDNARIVKIEPQRVTLEWNGETKILSIDPY